MYVQHQTTDYKRKKDYKHILQKSWQFLTALPMILDLLDNQNCYTILYVRCRHNLITTITATRICTANNEIIDLMLQNYEFDRLRKTQIWTTSTDVVSHIIANNSHISLIITYNNICSIFIQLAKMNTFLENKNTLFIVFV